MSASLLLRLILVLLVFTILAVSLVIGCLPPADIAVDDPPETSDEVVSAPESENREEDLPPEEDEDEAPDEAAESEEYKDDSTPATVEETPGSDSFKVIADGDYLLALVTKETTLKSDYRPLDLQAVPSYMNPYYSMSLRKAALGKLEELWAAAEEERVNLLAIRSTFRSYSTQESLFRDYASRYGEEQANRFSARPGQSEHQLGTTVDFGGTAVDFKAAYGDTEQGLWLAENAHLFGFAMSYPENKEDVTGYIYEPWHFRYIGVEAALEWKQSGKTLKEFLETKPQNFE